MSLPTGLNVKLCPQDGFIDFQPNKLKLLKVAAILRGKFITYLKFKQNVVAILLLDRSRLNHLDVLNYSEFSYLLTTVNALLSIPFSMLASLNP